MSHGDHAVHGNHGSRFLSQKLIDLGEIESYIICTSSFNILALVWLCDIINPLTYSLASHIYYHVN